MDNHESNYVYRFLSPKSRSAGEVSAKPESLSDLLDLAIGAISQVAAIGFPALLKGGIDSELNKARVQLANTPLFPTEIMTESTNRSTNTNLKLLTPYANILKKLSSDNRVIKSSRAGNLAYTHHSLHGRYGRTMATVYVLDEKEYKVYGNIKQYGVYFKRGTHNNKLGISIGVTEQLQDGDKTRFAELIIDNPGMSTATYGHSCHALHANYQDGVISAITLFRPDRDMITSYEDQNLFSQAYLYFLSKFNSGNELPHDTLCRLTA